jgi:hypothetical protein
MVQRGPWRLIKSKNPHSLIEVKDLRYRGGSKAGMSEPNLRSNPVQSIAGTPLGRARLTQCVLLREPPLAPRTWEAPVS